MPAGRPAGRIALAAAPALRQRKPAAGDVAVPGLGREGVMVTRSAAVSGGGSWTGQPGLPGVSFQCTEQRAQHPAGLHQLGCGEPGRGQPGRPVPVAVGVEGP